MKRSISELAIFGGLPTFQEPIHVGRPNIGDRAVFFKHVEGILDRAWVTNDGPCVRDFEERVRAIAGTRHCVAVCNATVGLEIAARALGMHGEVVMPSFTFCATAHALMWQGMRPVFCDIRQGTFLADPEDAEARFSGQTGGLVGVHTFGQACDIEAFERLAHNRKVPLLFDAAHAFGCFWRGNPICAGGTAAVFSFHATKFVNSLEGGALVTNDAALAETARRMRDFGFGEGHASVGLGINGKMHEVSAAMGLTSLDAMEGIVSANRRNRAAYEAGLSHISGVALARRGERDPGNCHYVVCSVDAAGAGCSRDTLMAVLEGEKVLARRYFHPGCHRSPPYSERGVPDLPVTDRACSEVLVLPNGLAVSQDAVNGICRLIAFAVSHGPEIEARLKSARLVRMSQAEALGVSATG